MQKEKEKLVDQQSKILDVVYNTDPPAKRIITAEKMSPRENPKIILHTRATKAPTDKILPKKEKSFLVMKTVAVIPVTINPAVGIRSLPPT